MVDKQSFPFQSHAYPLLWEGAYTPAERYSQDDIRALVEYGRMRGIKVSSTAEQTTDFRLMDAITSSNPSLIIILFIH